MPNADNPHGLYPLARTLSGGCPRIQRMSKDAAEATAIFMWDAVNREADGNIDAASATPGTTNYSGVSLNFGAALTLTEHLVIVSPDALFDCQGNSDGAIAEADMGLLANLELSAGSALTQISGHELDQSTQAVTATLDAKMLDKINAPDNEFGLNARILVVFNKHRMNGAVAGI